MTEMTLDDAVIVLTIGHTDHATTQRAIAALIKHSRAERGHALSEAASLRDLLALTEQDLDTLRAQLAEARREQNAWERSSTAWQGDCREARGERDTARAERDSARAELAAMRERVMTCPEYEIDGVNYYAVDEVDAAVRAAVEGEG